MVPSAGLEPTTSWVTARRSIQLSYEWASTNGKSPVVAHEALAGHAATLLAEPAMTGATGTMPSLSAW